VPEWTPRVNRLEAGDGGRLQYAKSLLHARRFDDAQLEVQQFLVANEKSVAALVTLGLAFLGQRRMDDALASFDKAIVADPLEPQPLVAAGFAHLQNKDAREAERCFIEALNLDADLPGAELGLAQAYNMQDRNDEARRLLSDLLARRPDMTAVRLLQARLHDKAGDVSAVVAEIDAVLERNPGQAGVARLMSILFNHHERLKYDETIRLFEAATRLNPSNAILWSWLGRIRLQSGHYVAAEAAFREASRRKRFALSAALGLVEVLVGQRRLDEARDVLDEMPRRRAVAFLIERGYGDIFLAEQRYEEAASHFRAALLGMAGGQEMIAAAEKDLPVSSAVAEPLARRYRTLLARVAARGKGRLTEEGWRNLGRRFLRAASRAGAHASEYLGVDPPTAGPVRTPLPGTDILPSLPPN